MFILNRKYNNSVDIIATKKEEESNRMGNENVGKLFTGERFIPGIEDDKLGIEHYQRYLSVRGLVQDKVVLDAACGEGYGSNIIASVAKNVTGLDIDADTIERAKVTYSEQNNLHFLQGSIESIPLGNESIDAVVSFETIEHVSEQIQHNFLNEIARVLKKDGILVMSTPNKEIYSDLYNYSNEFHVKEFYHDEFLEYLGEKFKYIKLFNQAFQVVSVLSACEGQKGEVSYYTDNNNYVQNGKYYIAVASNAEVDADSLASVYINRFGEYEENIQRIVTLQEEEEARNRHIAELDAELEAAGKRIVDLQDDDEKKSQHIQTLDGQIDGLNQRNREQNQQIDELSRQNNELNQQNNALSQQNNELNRQNDELNQQNNELNQQNNELNQQIQAKNGQIEELKQTVLNKEGHIELLLEVERAYEHEKTTHAYKFAKKLQRAGNWLLPLNSRRRFFARIIYNIFRHPKLMLHVINPKRIKNYLKYMRLEGMEGVKRRYEEAVDIERMQMDPASRLDLELEQINDSSSSEQRTAEDYDKITFPVYAQPTVSIIIPVYNEFDYTYSCLKSILKNSGDIAYEIVIADDCSTDVTKEIEKIAENARLITTQENVGFLLNCNNAAQYAKGKYILFLNNDTQVQENWLEPLVDLIEQDEKIGMVGSKLVYPDGFLQEAGGIVWQDASAWNYGNRKSPEDPEYNYVKEADYISGAAIMIRRRLWEEIGGFDERYVPAYCEDSDLAFEVRKHGYKVMYQPLSVVVHYEGVSNGTDTETGLKAYQVVNQQKFREKWQLVLEEHFPNAENVFSARDRSRNKKVLLMIDHYVPQYDKDAGSRTVFQYLRMFVNKGYHVKFIGDNFYRHEPYTTDLQQMGIEVLYGPYYANNWKEWIKENANSIEIVFLNRPHISVNYIDYIRNNTRAKIIYYGHDLHFLREMRKYELTKDKDALEASVDWKQKELELMKKADAVYYPSNVEVQEIAKIDSSINAKAITAYIFEDVADETYQFERRKDIMFVGGFTHTPNIDAVLWFTKEILPGILIKQPDIKFYIIGSNAPLDIQNLADANVIVKGFVSDEELAQFYGKCRISVVPLRYGAGIKGKVIEAMRYGIPVVTTSIGAEGIEGAEQILCIEDDAQTMTERFVMLYNDRVALEKMSKESIEYIRNNFSEESAWRVVEKDFS